ncbi:MAG: spermidine synthase [Burkholderiales bacterium]
MLLFAATIFLSSFLLFLVQPLIAKQILPWFGGAAGVWTTCLVFFQSALLLGYAYPDLVARKLDPRRQAWLHTLLLLASCVFLPVMAGEVWKPAGDANPILGILALLAGVIGLPYVMLSTTSPLVQTWFAASYPGASPYRLFALSNLASMLALLSYPFIIEPAIGVQQQALIWSYLYAVFALLAITCAFRAARAAPAALPPAGSPGAADAAAAVAEPAPAASTQAMWCALSATGSILLLGISTHVTQNISSIPLLWVVPLALYLLTFILTFDGRGWYRRGGFMLACGVWLAAMGATLVTPALRFELKFQVALFFSGLFVVCMFCHGELTHLKPAPRHLTRFYLMVALGGACGAFLTGIVAPLTLNAYYELELGLTLAALLLLLRLGRQAALSVRLGAALLVVGGIGVTATHAITIQKDAIFTGRNFYTVLRVKEYGKPDDELRMRVLVHGVINHGEQFMADQHRRAATRYYSSDSGVGRALLSRYEQSSMKVGILGLGAGAVSVYARESDRWRMYEINPMVLDIAHRHFTYLADTPARIEVVLGDGRLAIERDPPQAFDVLAMDAFSGDAVPAHLITSEAFAAYERHLKPDAILAVHISNRFIDLGPPLKALADKHGFHAVIVNENGQHVSDWVLLSKSRRALEHPQIAAAARPLIARPGIRAWTDDFHDLVSVLR